MPLRKYGNGSRNLRWTVAFISSFGPSLFFFLSCSSIQRFLMDFDEVWYVMFTVKLGFNEVPFIFRPCFLLNVLYSIAK
jgi:hypothetical protein